ncbi:transcriptional regulator [Puniceicoccaceae bacterium K14]|nr:transcriptional regulator [Puniceicoccaceae bacterium K14]
MGTKEGSYKGAHLETRRAILQMLKLQGELTSSEMAKSLSISTMAVRQHLHEMQESDDVSSSDRAMGVGRPTKVWKLTNVASRHFPDRHRDLAVGFLDSVRESCGQDAVDRALDLRKAQQLEAYQKELNGIVDVCGRVKRLVELRTAEGYMAEYEDLGSGSFLLSENHCPICDAATACERLCSNELEIFRTCLGDKVTVERTEHIVSGARRCAYEIKSKES